LRYKGEGPMSGHSSDSMDSVAAVLGVTMDNPDRSIIRKDVLNMVWPYTLENVLHFAVGIVSTAMVGRLGATALATVGLSMRVVSWVWVLSQAVTVGATVLVARAVGGQQREQAAHAAAQALFLMVFLGLALAATFFFFAESIIGIFPGESGLLSEGTKYLRIVAWGIPFTGISMTVGAVLRGSGDTKTPMYIAVLVNIVNIVLGYILIFGNLGFPRLGLEGGAVAVVSAQGVGCIAALVVLFLGKTLPISLQTLKNINVSLMRSMLSIGIPASAESAFWQAATFILTMLIVSLGTVPMAAHQVGLTVEGLSYMPAGALGVAATAFVGQSLGARRPHLSERYMREVLRWAMALCAITTITLVAIPKALLRLLTTDTAVIDLGAYYLILMGLAQFPQILAWVFNGALRGAGDTKSPMYFAGVGIWLVRLPLAFFFGQYLGMGILGVWWAMLVDILVRFGLSFWRYRQGKWKEAT